MTRRWTLAESRLIATQVFGWGVTEHNGRLFLTDSSQRPEWLTEYGAPSCAVPDWPRDPRAAAMALAELMAQGVTTWQGWDALKRQHYVTLHHQHDGRYPVQGESQDWAEAAMLAVLAAVER